MITDEIGVCKSASGSPAGRGEKRESSRTITGETGACKIRVELASWTRREERESAQDSSGILEIHVSRR